MLAYLEGFDGVRKAFVFHPDSKAEKVSVDKIEYPRSGTLFRVSIPSENILESRIWADVCEALFASLSATRSVDIAPMENQIGLTE